jgi:hypothetical protein
LIKIKGKEKSPLSAEWAEHFMRLQRRELPKVETRAGRLPSESRAGRAGLSVRPALASPFSRRLAASLAAPVGASFLSHLGVRREPMTWPGGLVQIRSALICTPPPKGETPCGAQAGQTYTPLRGIKLGGLASMLHRVHQGDQSAPWFNTTMRQSCFGVYGFCLRLTVPEDPAGCEG